MKKLSVLLFSIIFVIYMELVFVLNIFGNISTNFLYTVFFSIPIGLLLFFISSLFKKKFINKLLYLIMVIGITVIFIAQIIYFQFYQSLISFLSMTTGGQVFGFADAIIDAASRNVLPLVFMLLPLIILIIGLITKSFSFEYVPWKRKIITIILFIVVQASAILSVYLTDSTEMYSNKNLYYSVHAPLETANNMGMLTTMRLDFQRFVFGFEEKNLNDETKKEKPVVEKQIEYNKLNIDFDYLIKNETNSKVKSIHTYLSTEQASEKNEYTGMFKGKNLIVFVAEAFSNIAIDKDITPNLYKLYNEGFQFDNFYTPIFPVSTADGEYITDTSLIPKEGVWSIKAINGNYMPYSYANIFEGLGYTSQAYHNHTYNYYNRDKYIKTMGYDLYRGCKKNLKINCNIWPESDLDMIKATTKDYINDEHFLAYYMTVSGHLNYTKTGNTMVYRNWKSVKDLPYSAKAKGYLAANREFDKAIGELIKRLEEAGKLDDTVIMISGDHYPYGLNLKEINELSTFKRDKNFEMHHSAFLVWNSTMTEPIKIEKLGSSLDILPTMLNLFGVSFDSRLLIGRDILSNSDPLIIYSNRSFITDKGRYSSSSKKFTPVDAIDPSFDSTAYVKEINAIIYDKYKYSRLILETNYYKKLKTGMDKQKKELESQVQVIEEKTE